MAFELPSAVYSPQLLESVTYEIEQYLAWYRQTKVQKKVGAPLAEEPSHSGETVLVIEAWLEGKPATVERLESLIDYLKKLNMPVVHLSLAALPNHDQRARLVDWFRHEAGSRPILISFIADRTMGGGVMVRTPNRLFDLSWKQQLIAGRAHLAEILRRER